MSKQRHESPLQSLVTISRDYGKSLTPRDYLEDLIENCGLAVKSVTYENVFIPVAVDNLNGQTIMYDGRLCKAVLRANVLIEGEYSLDELESAFRYEQDYIRVFLDYVYEA